MYFCAQQRKLAADTVKVFATFIVVVSPWNVTVYQPVCCDLNQLYMSSGWISLEICLLEGYCSLKPYMNTLIRIFFISNITLAIFTHSLQSWFYLGITDWISGDQTVFNLQASTRVRILQSIHIVSQFHVHCPLHTLPRQLHEKCFQESGHGWSDVSPLVSYLWETATSDNVRKKLIKWINCALQSYGLALF